MKIVKYLCLIFAINACCTFKTIHAEHHDPHDVTVTKSIVSPTTEKSTHSIVDKKTEELAPKFEKSEVISPEESNTTLTSPHSANQSEKVTPSPGVEIENDDNNTTPNITGTDSEENTMKLHITENTENFESPNVEEDYNLEGTSESYDFNATSESEINNGRIIGSVGADPVVGDFPFAAVVTTPNVRTCTGALITTRFVLVPASCVTGNNAVTSVSLATVSVTGTPGTAAVVSRKIIHPKYSISPKDYNIALLRLSAPATGANILPIQLASKRTTDDNKDLEGQQLRVLGYGPITENDAVALKILRFVGLTVLSKSICYQQTKFDDTIPYSSKQSCLANSPTLGLCGQADLGALVLRGTALPYNLVGFVTYIHGCGSTVPSLFTRVGQHYDWIQKVIEIYGSSDEQ